METIGRNMKAAHIVEEWPDLFRVEFSELGADGQYYNCRGPIYVGSKIAAEEAAEKFVNNQ